MNRMKLINIIILTLTLVALFLSGCDLHVGTPSLSPLPSEMAPSPTPTVLPQKLTSPLRDTEIPDATSTVALKPTLSPAEDTTFLQSLISTNMGCLLPCWWSIIPGETNWSTVDDLLTQLGIKTMVYPREQGPTFHETGGFDFPEQQIFNKLAIFESKGIVVSLEIRADGFHNPSAFKEIWGSFAPEEIIPEYGAPSRVWLTSRSTVHEGQPGNTMPYAVWVFYDYYGFLLRYQGHVDFQDIYQMCPFFRSGGNLGEGIDFFLQSPERKLPLEALTDLEQIGAPPLSLEEATGMSTDEFYALYARQDAQLCFETPRDVWP